MAPKKANTPKAAKPPGKTAQEAGEHSTADGQRATRDSTNTREEIRQQIPQRQGHPK